MYKKMYYIGTDKTFIRVDKNGQAIATMNFSDAKFFANKQKAGQFLVSLPRKLYNISTKWEVKEFQDLSEDKQTEYQENKPPQTQVKETAINNTVRVPEIDYLNLLDSVSILKDAKKGCMTGLNTKLSDISQKIVDLEHYIEFSKLNACEAYRAYKMLRDTLQDRRKIKDTIAAAQSLYKNCNVEKLSDCNDHLHNRTYNPRKLTSLFE